MGERGAFFELLFMGYIPVPHLFKVAFDCKNRRSCRFIASKEHKNCLIQSPGAIEGANPEGVKHMDVLNKTVFLSLRSAKPDRLLEARSPWVPILRILVLGATETLFLLVMLHCGISRGRQRATLYFRGSGSIRDQLQVYMRLRSALIVTAALLYRSCVILLSAPRHCRGPEMGYKSIF